MPHVLSAVILFIYLLSLKTKVLLSYNYDAFGRESISIRNGTNMRMLMPQRILCDAVYKHQY